MLRFDKVTYAHPEYLAATAGFAPSDEYVPHAVAGIETLRDLPTVDGERVFVVGHSVGGKFAPRVAATEPAVAGPSLRRSQLCRSSTQNYSCTGFGAGDDVVSAPGRYR
ncbi:hypothetical protein [Nocardia brasiliensis]|uniref:hypothetical protein n=1 Tax=Nocardia brasiliensis TaxID=37326 RepID=UPI00366BA902